MKLIFILTFLSLFFSCTKDINKKYCWRLINQFNAMQPQVCGKTEAEIKAEYPNYNYCKADEPLYCWYKPATVGNGDFIEQWPETLIRKAYPGENYNKVPCNYCMIWYMREKRKYKPTSLFSYSQPWARFLCGDTVTKLYRGREIFLRENTDTLVTLQFSDDINNW